MTKYITLLFLLTQLAFSQEVEVQNVLKNFEGKSQTEYSLPISKQENIKISWHERKSSFSEKEGIRTFVGYVENQMVGVISLFQNQISGSISWKGKNYKIKTRESKLYIKEDTTEGSCGTCQNGICHTENHDHNPFLENKKSLKIAAKTAKLSEKESASIIPSDGILRIYRLAVLVDYSYFSEFFNNNKSAVNAFLSGLEVGLNEIYMRDLGIKFEMVKHPELIRDTPEKLVYNWRTGTIINFSTLEINKILGNGDVDEGRKQYDLGISLAPSNTESGLATLFGAYKNATKAAAHSSPSLPTIAHEIGHLFGGRHTFSKDGKDGFQTEPESGTSVMSYGSAQRDFFSLFSIGLIGKELAQYASVYYTTRERTQDKMVGTPSAEQNIIFAIDTKNQPPVLDRTKIKPKYQLPPQTAFQFDIKATDPEGKPLIYWAHQTDVKRMPAISNTRFISKKPTSNPVQPFDPEYFVNLLTFKNSLRAYTEFGSSDRGNFTFWIGAGDADISAGYWERENHATRIDAMAVTVEVVEGKPFKLTSKVGNLDKNGKATRKYNGGQKTTLTWQVDKKIFGENSRVRILMSDDFGKSWKYVLNPDTENDGSEEIVIPNTDLSQRIQHERRASSGKGLFRIEVLDHIATAMTDGGALPINGGFEIHQSKIKFTSVPESFVKVKRNQIPEIHNVTAETSCVGDKNVSISLQKNEEKNQIITRIWEAKDHCGNTAFYQQKIEIQEEKIPLVWEKLPEKKLNYECPSDLPISPILPEVEGGKNSAVVTYRDEIVNTICSEKYTIERTFMASEGEEKIFYKQEIVIGEGNVPPVWQQEMPKDVVLPVGSIRPAAAYDLKAKPKCGGEEARVRDEQEEIVKNGQVVGWVYTYIAIDDCGNVATHTQKIGLGKSLSEEPLAWENFPSDKKVSCENLAPVENPTTKGGEKTPTITHFDQRENGNCANSYTIKRTYTATDGKTTISKTQTIEIEDKTPPVFVEKLPQDTEAEENNIPAQANLTATDTCGNASVEKSVEDISENRKLVKRIYKWVAKDDCGNETTHTQTITIKNKAIQPIAWVESSLPKDENYICRASVPEKSTASLRVTGGEGKATFNVSETTETSTCTNKVTIKRTFTATEKGKTITHTQTIVVNDTTKPTFVEKLPQDTEAEENSIPTQANLTATDTCGNASVEKSVEDISESGKLVKRIYKWVAKDDCGNIVEHSQTITIKAKEHSELPKTPETPKIPNDPKTPENSTLLIYNGVSLEEGSENYFRVEGIETTSPISVEIFNELGQKVFQSSHYGQKGEVFRGYPNVTGVFNPSKRLPTGTYFYILKYDTTSKSGYLFVR